MVRMSNHLEAASFDLLLKSGALDDALDVLEKAYGTERAGHKYKSRRRNAKGEWEYEYATPRAKEHAQMAFGFAAEHGTPAQQERALDVLKQVAPDTWQEHVHEANAMAEHRQRAAAPVVDNFNAWQREHGHAVTDAVAGREVVRRPLPPVEPGERHVEAHEPPAVVRFVHGEPPANVAAGRAHEAARAKLAAMGVALRKDAISDRTPIDEVTARAAQLRHDATFLYNEAIAMGAVNDEAARARKFGPEQHRRMAAFHRVIEDEYRELYARAMTMRMRPPAGMTRDEVDTFRTDVERAYREHMKLADAHDAIATKADAKRKPADEAPALVVATVETAAPAVVEPTPTPAVPTTPKATWKQIKEPQSPGSDVLEWNGEHIVTVDGQQFRVYRNSGHGGDMIHGAYTFVPASDTTTPLWEGGIGFKDRETKEKIRNLQQGGYSREDVEREIRKYIAKQPASAAPMPLVIEPVVTSAPVVAPEEKRAGLAALSGVTASSLGSPDNFETMPDEEPEEIKDPSARAQKIAENRAKRDAEAAMQAGATRLTGDERHAALTRMGEHLHAIQDFDAGKDDTGMASPDMKSWARATTAPRKARILRKYRRQLVEQLGDLYFKAGLHEKEPIPKGHTPAVGEWTERGGLVVKVDGYLGTKFHTWKDLLRQHGFKWNGQRGDASADGMHADKAAALDVPGFIEAASKIGIHIEIPEKPERAPDAPAAANEPEHEPEPVAPAADRPVSSDETTRAINDIRGRRARNTVALTVRDDGQYAFYAADFRKKDVPGSFWHTMSSSNGAISGLMDVNASDWSVNTYSADLATEALDKLKAANPTFHFFVDPKATAAIAKAAADKAEAQKPIPDVVALLADGFALKPYQNEMVRFLDTNNGNAIVGDEMGLGKTLQSLAWVAKGGHKAIVVVPKVVRRTWIEEAHKFFPGHFDAKELRSKDLIAKKGKKGGTAGIDDPAAFLAEMQGTKSPMDLTGKNLVTVNYESLEKFMPYLKAAGFDTIIVDESHRAKNPKAKTTKTIQAIAKTMKHRILMSGTAVKNGKEELFTQLEMVKPGLWGSAKELKHSTHGKAWSKMREHYLARSKKNVLKDLPEKTTTISILYAPGAPDIGERKEPKPPPPGATERQIAAYEKAALEWEEAEEAKHDDQEFEDEAEGEYRAGGRSKTSTSIGEYSKVRGQLALAKVDSTVDMVKEILDSSDSKVLVFTESVAAAKAIAEQLGAEAILHYGQQSDDKREAAKNEFQREGSPKRVFVSTRPSLAVGATLTAADKVVFNDLPWTAADVRQAEDRAHRVGQKNAVNVYWNVAEDNNFDENVAAILRRKYDLSKKINEGSQFTPEEKAWMDKPVTMAEVMARIKGKPIEPAEAPIKKSARAELRDATRALLKASR